MNTSLTLSPALVDFALKMRAADENALVARTSTRRFIITSTARLVSIITSPADQAGIWGVAHARPGAGEATIAATGDPGSIVGQQQIFDKLGQQWGMWVTTTLEAGGLPQLVYASVTCRDAMVWAAKRVSSSSKSTPAARMAAALVLNTAHLGRTAGSMAAPTALELIREHFTSPLDTAEETHLGVWVDFPAITPASERSMSALDEDAAAEGTTLGKAFDKMHAQVGERRISRAARLIPLLEPHLHARHKDLVAALALLEKHPGTPAPYLNGQMGEDAAYLVRAMAGPYTPNPGNLPAAIATLGARERALEAVTKTLWATDQLEQARGITSGDVLTGTPQGSGLLVGGASLIRARTDDAFTGPDGRTYTVTNLDTTDTGTLITFNKPLPDTGGVLILTPAISTHKGRWVKETWVNTGTHPQGQAPGVPAPDGGEVAAAGGWGAWAESLKR